MKKLRVLNRGVDGTTLTIYKGYSDERMKDLYFREYNTVTRYALQGLGTLEEDKDNKFVFESFDDTVRIEVELTEE